ncbi:hypothetical protein DPEC_G00349180 [Dallia pectoralis]|uniref:Uncharacterized protein n=1 Tax=Dallia pectoralis TaxID=75939 RepID=A0ACC2F1F0_DALPE|nr:hypothetical protein DPEC_G00349180 [Dallia pectoralis]
MKEKDQLQVKLNKLEMERNGPSRFGQSLYYLSTEKKSWSQGRQECRNMGLDLAIVNSQEEQKFLYGLNNACGDMWIGLHDISTEGKWEWVDSTLATATYWMKGEPNDYGNAEDCALISHRSTDPLTSWNDAGCDNYSINWICENSTETRGRL